MKKAIRSSAAVALCSLALASSIAASAAVNLHQYGLTGSWYEPASSGQGLEVEVFPDLSAPGAGLVQVSWFTYDTSAGGPERQRWYTLSSPVSNGQVSAVLTIYQNVGGNFNAPPVTSALAVGTATLSFDTCTSGQLSYAFTDGSGRSGSTPLTRLTQNVTCATTGQPSTNADFAFSGNWYDPATSGQGLTIEVNPNSRIVFGAWYTYAPNGSGAGAAGQRWYTAQSASFSAGTRSIPVTLYETTGGVFDTPTTPGQRTVAVGNGTLSFQSCSAATFSYAFTGGSSSGSSNTITLKRVGPVPKGCTDQPQPGATMTGSWSGSFNDSVASDVMSANIVQSGTSITGSFNAGFGAASGTLAGTVNGTNFSFTLQQTTPSCRGSFSGSGSFTATTLTATFSGSDCLGMHNNGRVTLMRQ